MLHTLIISLNLSLFTAVVELSEVDGVGGLTYLGLFLVFIGFISGLVIYVHRSIFFVRVFGLFIGVCCFIMLL